MSVLKENKTSKFKDNNKYGQSMEGVFEAGERLFNMLTATYANVGILSAFTKGGKATDKAMAEESVEVYDNLKQMLLDYDDTIRHQTEVIDKMEKELEDLHKLVRFMDEKQKSNYQDIKERLDKLNKTTDK